MCHSTQCGTEGHVRLACPQSCNITCFNVPLFLVVDQQQQVHHEAQQRHACMLVKLCQLRLHASWLAVVCQHSWHAWLLVRAQVFFVAGSQHSVLVVLLPCHEHTTKHPTNHNVASNRVHCLNAPTTNTSCATCITPLLTQFALVSAIYSYQMCSGCSFSAKPASSSE